MAIDEWAHAPASSLGLHTRILYPKSNRLTVKRRGMLSSASQDRFIVYAVKPLRPVATAEV